MNNIKPKLNLFLIHLIPILMLQLIFFFLYLLQKIKISIIYIEKCAIYQ